MIAIAASPIGSMAAIGPCASSRRSFSASAACARWPSSGYEPTVWHMNEGHAAFLVLERIRVLRQAGLDFASALEAVAVNTVFTTHTAVPAGHDHFPEEMLAGYFASYARELGIDNDTLLALGRTPAGNDFDMTALAVRGSRFHNGVSRLHGQVSAGHAQRHVAADFRGRKSDRPRHQRRARSHLFVARMDRCLRPLSGSGLASAHAGPSELAGDRRPARRRFLVGASVSQVENAADAAATGARSAFPQPGRAKRTSIGC